LRFETSQTRKQSRFSPNACDETARIACRVNGLDSALIPGQFPIMIRFITALILAVCLPLGLQAQDSNSGILPDAGASLRGDDPDLRTSAELSSQPGSTVVLRGLDKVTARTRDFEIPIGESVEFGALTITAQYCRKRPPEETPETYAFLQVVDRRTDGFGVDIDGEMVFSGWMFASRPAQNPLEHAIYDVWVLDCRD